MMENTISALDISMQNVPQSYKDFMAKTLSNQGVFIRYTKKDDVKTVGLGVDCDVYCYDMLIKNNPYDKNSPPNYRLMQYLDLEYKALEGETKSITLEQIRRAFCFGSVDGGQLIFHPENHSVWEVYLDLYVCQTTKNFENLLTDGEMDTFCLDDFLA